MESGLEDRNNKISQCSACKRSAVSMESGLEDRNNTIDFLDTTLDGIGLNGVRPRRPEQCCT